MLILILGCVINNENVWVNIQADVSPSHVLFDIENKKNWMPFLGYYFEFYNRIINQ